MKVAVLAAILLTGCCTNPSVQWKPDASLVELCDSKGPLLTAGDGASIAIWGVEMRKEYETCAARHKRLVEAIPKEK